MVVEEVPNLAFRPLRADDESHSSSAWAYRRQTFAIGSFSTGSKEITMSLLGFLVLLIIAAICGAIGQALAGFSTGGFLISIVLGFVGAFLGVWLAQQFGLPEIFVINIDGQPFPIVWSIVGAALLALLAGLLSRPRAVY